MCIYICSQVAQPTNNKRIMNITQYNFIEAPIPPELSDPNPYQSFNIFHKKGDWIFFKVSIKIELVDEEHQLNLFLWVKMSFKQFSKLNINNSNVSSVTLFNQTSEIVTKDYSYIYFDSKSQYPILCDINQNEPIVRVTNAKLLTLIDQFSFYRGN